VQDKKVGTGLEAGGAPAWSRLSAGFLAEKPSATRRSDSSARPSYFFILHPFLLSRNFLLDISNCIDKMITSALKNGNADVIIF
jgi:hypothetical protein